jgi:acyl-CoA synthetase (AMP-forming)/AMP-acid ligase II
MRCATPTLQLGRALWLTLQEPAPAAPAAPKGSAAAEAAPAPGAAAAPAAAAAADSSAGCVLSALLAGADALPALTGAAVKAFIAGKVAEYKQLADVIFVDAIPKNPSGKILRRVLRDRLVADAKDAKK